ncbi:hypothetical protein T11_12213 [Trichinella zimbabwensis]|uniref:Uncharacterized protein n=1 Tax=Trichinella zimbabwensis TaxID=268475 RepID=A0A0V1HDH9_9BILA|nr:hypothetical protein T11_12213 [Trichinella zimbabwensis]
MRNSRHSVYYCMQRLLTLSIIFFSGAFKNHQVWRFFSENEDKKSYYFYRSCTNDCIPGCTPLDDVEIRFMSCVSCSDYDF